MEAAAYNSHVLRWSAPGVKAQELCESRSGRPGLPVPDSPYGFFGLKAAFEEENEDTNIRAQELCESGGGRPGVLVSNSPYGFFGLKAAFEEENEDTNIRAQELCESGGGRPGVLVSNSPYGFFGLKAAFEEEMKTQTSELRSCVKVEVDVLGSSSLIVLMVSLDLKQHLKKK